MPHDPAYLLQRRSSSSKDQNVPAPVILRRECLVRIVLTAVEGCVEVRFLGTGLMHYEEVGPLLDDVEIRIQRLEEWRAGKRVHVHVGDISAVGDWQVGSLIACAGAAVVVEWWVLGAGKN